MRGTPTGRRVRPPEAGELARAAEVVAAHLATTPVIRTSHRSRPLVLKLEGLQPTGSFKVRGALAAVAAAVSREPGAALVAASAGNHGLGVAWAARRLGASAVVVVPETASPAKLAALARLPVEVVRVAGGYDEAEAHALALAHQPAADTLAPAHPPAGEPLGATPLAFVSPYNDPHVIAGQATMGTELRSQVHDLACVVAPVGGGGLVSGLAMALAPFGIAVYGVETEGSAVMKAAVDAPGPLHRMEIAPTIADGLAGNIEPASVTIEVVRSRVAGLVTVSEEEIMGAMRYLATEHGLVVEGAGAVAMAAVLADRVPASTGSTAVIVTGRNIDPATFALVLATRTS